MCICFLVYTIHTDTYIITTAHNNNEHDVNWGKNQKYKIKT